MDPRSRLRALAVFGRLPFHVVGLAVGSGIPLAPTCPEGLQSCSALAGVAGATVAATPSLTGDANVYCTPTRELPFLLALGVEEWTSP